MTALDQSKAPTAAGDPYRAYRLAGNAFATIILMASVAELVWNIRHPTVRDFLGFWSAAQLALAGHPAAAYDNAALHAVQSAVALGTAKLPFSYPPAYLLLVMPFGLLPFATGMIAWSLSTLAFYVSAARRLFPSRAGLQWLSPPFLQMREWARMPASLPASSWAAWRCWKARRLRPGRFWVASSSSLNWHCFCQLR